MEDSAMIWLFRFFCHISIRRSADKDSIMAQLSGCLSLSLSLIRGVIVPGDSFLLSVAVPPTGLTSRVKSVGV